MAEVGLVAFAKCELAMGQRVMPAYRRMYLKHTFTQLQLLVMLCLMRCEDWTFRETELRLHLQLESTDVL